eukprot:jgi/Psemu1/62351/gm1.62351_g
MALELALLGYYYDNDLTPDYNSPLLGLQLRDTANLLSCIFINPAMIKPF